MEWADETGVVTLPSGLRIRGRALVATVSPADLLIALARGPRPAWETRDVRWPDFGVPLDTADAIDALRLALRRAAAGERVEIACSGGTGRTGTALAALAVLEGKAPDAAVRWVRSAYRPRAVETPWQARWLRRVAAAR